MANGHVSAVTDENAKFWQVPKHKMWNQELANTSLENLDHELVSRERHLISREFRNSKFKI